MNNDECAVVLGVLQGAFRGKWTPEQEDYWLFALHSYDMGDARKAVALLALSIDYVPSIHQFDAACKTVAGDRIRNAALKALARPKDNPEPTAAVRRLMLLTEKIKKLKAEHGRAHGRPVPGCALCNHDHSNTTVFGYTKVTQRGDYPGQDGLVVVELPIPVPGWWFSCPVNFCGWPEHAQYSCDTWTSDGIAWMRAFREQGGVSQSERAARKLAGVDPERAER